MTTRTPLSRRCSARTGGDAHRRRRARRPRRRGGRSPAWSRSRPRAAERPARARARARAIRRGSHRTGGAYQKESGTGRSALPGSGVLWPEHETAGVLAGAGGRGRRARVRARAGASRRPRGGTGSSIACATRRSTSARALIAAAARGREIVDVALAGLRAARRAGRDGAITLAATPSRGRPTRSISSSTVRARDASLLDHRIALDLRRLVARQLRRAAGRLYAGNRFQSRRAAYPPLLTEPADIGPHVPPIVPDIPRLSAGSGPSRAAAWRRRRALAIPAAAAFTSPRRRASGIIVAAPTARRRAARRRSRSAIAEERRPRRRATLTHRRPRAATRSRSRVHVFDCADIPALFERLFALRKELTGRDRAGQRAAVLGGVRRARGAGERPLGREARLPRGSAIARQRVHDLADGLGRRPGDDAAADRRRRQAVARARARDRRLRARRRPGAVRLLSRHLRRQDLVRRRLRGAAAGRAAPTRRRGPAVAYKQAAAGTSSGAAPRR